MVNLMCQMNGAARPPVQRTRPAIEAEVSRVGRQRPKVSWMSLMHLFNNAPLVRDAYSLRLA
jgi:hypothetical protein